MSKEIRDALRLLNISLVEIAERLGVSHDTVKGWSAGRTDPSAENRVSLVAFMREHAERVAEAADRLEKTAASE